MTAWNRSRAVLRPDVVGRAVALCVDTRHGVLVVGPPGAGASQCAADIAAGLRAAGVPVVVWDDLDRVTPPGPPRGAGSPDAVRGGAGSPDAVRGGAVLVASARLGAPLPPGYDDEVSVRTTRLPLRTFSRAETEATVSEILGIALSARLVEALWTCSHGNLAALRATFDDLAARGYVRRTRERMELTVDPATAVAEVTVDPRLWIDPATAGRHTAPLTTAALARRIALPDLEALHGDDVVDDLLARGLLTERREDGVELVTVQPPVLAAALCDGADHRTRRETYEAVLARAHSTHPDPRLVLWALEHDRVALLGPDDAALVVVAAARAARYGHDYTTGVDLHRAATRTGLPSAAVQRAELALSAGACLRLLERLPEAAAALDEAMTLLPVGAGDPVGDDPEVARVLVETVTARADLAHYRDRTPDGALAMIADAHRLLPAEHPAHAELEALTVVHLTYSGRYRDAARAYTALGSGAPPAWERRLDAMHALALDALGQSDAALALLRRLARRARSMGHVAWATEEYLSALLSVVLHGFGITALGGELTSFSALDQGEPNRVDHGIRRTVDAEIALFAGDLPAATSAADDAVETIDVDGPEDFLPRALSLAALASALSGQSAAAGERLRRMRAIEAYTLSPVGPEIRAAEAGVLYCLGRPGEARQIVRSLAAEGLHGAAIRGAMAGILTGDPETCRIARELDVTGDLPEMLAELAAATMAESPRRMLEVARLAREAGLLVVAAATAERARTVAPPGTQQHGLAERMLATLDVRSPFADAAGPAGALPPGVTLTRRESEIVDLVAQGLTNAEIAAELHLSKRTVEGHLNRIYTKTGARLRG